MNRDMNSATDFPSTKINHSIGEQPRKLMSRRAKKSRFFERFDNENDDIELDKHRQSYKRASTKYASRIQLNSSETIF